MGNYKSKHTYSETGKNCGYNMDFKHTRIAVKILCASVQLAGYDYVQTPDWVLLRDRP